MGTHELFPYSRTIAKDRNKQPEHRITPIGLDSIVNFLPLRKDRQRSSFEDVLKKASDDFPKLKMHADLHPSEYRNAIGIINGLPTQLQNKWRLFRLCLWNQYGSSIFGEIFNLTPDKTRVETALLSDLPDELTSKISKLLEDSEEEEAVENTTTVLLLTNYNGRVNPEKRQFVILAESGQKWKTLTDNQRIVLQERYLADRPEPLKALAGRLGMDHRTVWQIEAAGLSKLGFFGDPISLTRQQLQNIFKNAKEEDINSLTPKQRELLERLYGANAQAELSQPTIKSVAADLKIHQVSAVARHKAAIQKLLHTKRGINIDTSFQPTPEQVEFMRQKILLEGTDKVAKEMGVTVGVARRWLRQEKIESRPQGRLRITLPPEVLEFIKTNYLEMSMVAMAKLTGYNQEIIARSLRAEGIPIGNTTR